MYHFLNTKKNVLYNLSMTLLMLLVVSGIGSLFYRMGLDDATIILLYLLGVMILAILTSHRLYCVIFSIVSVLSFNYLFTYPQFTFQAYNKNHIATFLIFFAASFLAGALAIQLKNHARMYSQDAYSAQVLFNTSQQLSKAKDASQVFSCTAVQLHKLMNTGIIIYPIQDANLQPSITYGTISQDMLYKNEKNVVDKVLKKGAYAGLIASEHGVYAPIHMDDSYFGIAGIETLKEQIDSFEENILLSILGESAMALKNLKILKEKEEAAILAENERLRSNLLRMISHDLRTPLTSIYGNASNLLNHEVLLDDSVRHNIYTDIYDDSKWLIDLVENLLAITRLEEGGLDLHISDDVIEDVIDEALNRIDRHKKEHSIEFLTKDAITVAKMDSRLIVQVLVNLINNAIKYTPPGSCIQIETCTNDKQVEVRIKDDGPGIPDEKKEKIFEMFYTGADKIADSRRSLGLGLALCQNVIQAHHGTIKVEDNVPHGSIFTFTLPAGGIQ